VKTSSRQLKPDSCQTHQHKTDRLIPDTRQKHTQPDSTIGAITAAFEFFATTVATARTLFKFFPHRTNGALVQLSLTDIGYYIRSRQIVKIVHGLTGFENRATGLIGLFEPSLVFC
jgi:hypothetical protein